MLTSTLERLGLVPEDVVRTNMDSSPAFTAFQAGSGDLVQANSSFYFNAEDEGWVPVTTGVTQDIYMPSVIVASDKMIEENPETVEKWVRAYMKRVLIGLALACLTGIPLGLLMGWSKTD